MGFSTPQGWTSLQDDDHIILVEHAKPIGADGLLNGLIVHVWLPKLAELADIQMTPATTTSELLGQIVALYVPSEHAVTSALRPLRAAHYDGAYYLLNSGDGNITMVLMLKLDPHHLVAFNISTQLDNLDSIPHGLGQVLAGFTINGELAETDWVGTLPSLLEVPTFKGTAAPPRP